MTIPSLTAAFVTICCLMPPAASAADGRLPLKDPVDPPRGAVGLCAALPFACDGGTGQPIAAADLPRIDAINRQANHRITPLTDTRQYGRPEVWSLPTPAGGDCEDYALWKKRALIVAGLAPDRLLIATVLDRARVSHAVLIVRAEGGDLVLDNLTDEILPWGATGYTFLRVQDPASPGGWVASFSGGILAVSRRADLTLTPPT